MFVISLQFHFELLTIFHALERGSIIHFAAVLYNRKKILCCCWKIVGEIGELAGRSAMAATINILRQSK